MKINPNAPTFVQWKTRPFAKIALLRPSLRTFLWNLARLFISLWSFRKMSFEILRLGHQRSKGKKLSRLSNGLWLHFFFWVIKMFKIFTWFEVLKKLSVVAEKLSIKKTKNPYIFLPAVWACTSTISGMFHISGVNTPQPPEGCALKFTFLLITSLPQLAISSKLQIRWRSWISWWPKRKNATKPRWRGVRVFCPLTSDALTWEFQMTFFWDFIKRRIILPSFTKMFGVMAAGEQFLQMGVFFTGPMWVRLG